MSIATVQGHLDPQGLGLNVSIPNYLNDLCESLAKSMIGNRRSLKIIVNADKAKVTTDGAIGLGLITAELIINSLKHAFNKQKEGVVTVIYETKHKNWILILKENGQGMSKDDIDNRKGLGTGIVDSLAKQLDAIVEVKSSPEGTTVSIIHK